MNRFYAISGLFLFSFSAFSQNISLCNQVVASTGKSVQKAGRTYAWTVGEPVIHTLKDNSGILTQGFHQPDLCLFVSTNESVRSEWGIEVFPNPASTAVTIKYDADKGARLQAVVVDQAGRVIENNLEFANPDGELLPCEHWQPGAYILQLSRPGEPATTSVRIIKL